MNYFYDLDEDPDDNEDIAYESEGGEEEKSSSNNNTDRIREELEKRKEQTQNNNTTSNNSSNTTRNSSTGSQPGSTSTPPTSSAGGTPPPATASGASSTAGAATTTGTTAASTAGTTAATTATTSTAASTAAAGAASGAAAGGAAAGGAAAGSSIMSAIAAGGPYVWIAVAIIVAIIVLLIILSGIFMFLATMPGMAMDSLKGLFKSAGNFLAALFGADTTQVIDNEKVFETLDYLDDMGWDVKGDGFLTKHIENESDLSSIDSTIKETAKLEDGYYIDDLMGVVRRTKNPSGEDADSADDIILAESDFIFTYIMSDNYIYTIKNENIATQRDKFKGPLGWLDDAINRINCFRISCI